MQKRDQEIAALNKDWTENPRWQGAAWLEAGEFKKAASLFAGLPRAEDAYNHGNSLVMLGKYEEAAARYERALELRPGWVEAEQNRAIALGRAERMRSEGGDMTGGMLGADEIVFDGVLDRFDRDRVVINV